MCDLIKPITIRIYFGGFFVTKCNSTVCDWKGFRIKTLKEEVFYFEIAHLIENDYGLDDVGRIWYKKNGVHFI